MSNIIDIELLSWQRDYMNDILSFKYREVYAFGGVGAGKSFINAFIILQLMSIMPDEPGFLYGQTWGAVSTSIEQYGKVFEKYGIRYWRTDTQIGKYPGPRLCIEFNGKIGRHHLRSLEGGEKSITGFTASWSCGDEFPDGNKDAWDLIFGRVGRIAGCREPLHFGTSNPPRVEAWGLDYFTRTDDEKMKVYTGLSSLDNIMTPDTYREDLKRKYKGKLGDREVGGKLIRLSGSVWDPVLIPYTFRKDLPYYLSWDFGRRKAAVIAVQEFMPGKYCVFDAYAPENQMTRTQAEKIKERMRSKWGTGSKPLEIFCDPAGDSNDSRALINDVQILEQSFGCPVNYVSASSWRRVGYGTNLVISWFIDKKLHVSDALNKKDDDEYVSYIDAITRLQYDEKKDRLLDGYRKDNVNDHFGDCTRYFAMNVEFKKHGSMTVL